MSDSDLNIIFTSLNIWNILVISLMICLLLLTIVWVSDSNNNNKNLSLDEVWLIIVNTSSITSD